MVTERKKNEEAVYGDGGDFRVTVRRDHWESDAYNITLWNRNHGTSFPTIFDEQKANTVAAFLYETLLPHYEEAQRRQAESSEKMMAEIMSRPKPKPPRIPKNAPIITVLECPDCNALTPPDEVSDERVYECNTCGTTGTGDDGRRCDQCNKFTAKLSDTSCPECGAAMDDAEEVQAQRATNKTLVKVE